MILEGALCSSATMGLTSTWQGADSAVEATLSSGELSTCWKRQEDGRLNFVEHIMVEINQVKKCV